MTSRGGAALPFIVLYVAIGAALFLLMRDHGFHPTDDGFVLAYSWRIAHGEIPYRDFVFERTPLTPYLHVAWLALPDGWQLQAGRFAFYVEMVCSALFPTLWAVSRGLRANTLTLAIAGSALLIAFHNFPPMPWMTVDGVFFASAGVSAFLVWWDRRSARWLPLAVTALVLSTLAKQSFAPLLVVVIACACIAAWRRRDVRAGAAAVGPAVLLGAAFFLALAATGALRPFLEQISQPTQMRPTATNPWTGDILTIGVLPYLTVLPALLPLFALMVWSFATRDTSARAARLVTPLIAADLLLAAVLMPISAFVSGFVVFFGVAALAIAEAIRTARGSSPPVPLIAYGLVLLAAWCASLSFAYQSPVLAMGMAPAVIAPVTAVARARAAGAAAVIALVACLVASLFVNVERPYRDLPRDAETADLGGVYAQFGHLYTNATNAARHSELRDLVQRFALDKSREFVVFTAFPLAHYLTGTRDPLSVDWLEPQEYLGNEERLRAELERSRPVLILQRQVSETVGLGDPPLSCAEAVAAAPGFATDLLRRSALATEGTYFCVYTP